jgi:predicted GNAT family N-acyltransferase
MAHGIALTVGPWRSAGPWQTLGERAKPIRFQVFVHEQGIDPAVEIDQLDALSLHCVAFLHGHPVGTGRLLPDGHIGRMAVLEPYRRYGVGGLILERLALEAKTHGHMRVALSAQLYVEAFYQRHGFIRDGDVFMLEGIEHISMWRSLSLQV